MKTRAPRGVSLEMGLWLVLPMALGCGQVLDTAPPDPRPDSSVADSGGGGFDAGHADTGLDGGVDGSLDSGLDSGPECSGDVGCDDGLACTVDRCIEGVCDHSEPLACDDGIDCTVDACVEERGGCVHEAQNDLCGGSVDRPKVCVPARDGCIDATPCTTRDDCPPDSCAAVFTCAPAGFCDVAVPVAPAEGECLRWTCEPDTPGSGALGWVATRDPEACDDGASCTADTCQIDGSCTHEVVARACSDGWGCTEDTCAPGAFGADEGGCVHAPVDAACAGSDRFPCTVDTCNPSGSGGLLPDTRGCVHLPDDTLCSDGIDCTEDRCTAVADGDMGCTFTPVHRNCDDRIECTTDICDPTIGRADSCVHLPDDTVCASVGIAGTCIQPVCAPAASTDVPGTGCAESWDPNLCVSPLPMGGEPYCDSTGACGSPVFPPSCATNADCDDRNPCNGVEVCRLGRCHQQTTSCRGSGDACLLPVCDWTRGSPMCAFRPNPDCVATGVGGAGP